MSGDLVSLGGAMRLKKTINCSYIYQSADNTNTSHALTAAQVLGLASGQSVLPVYYIGADEVVLDLTGTLGSGQNIQLPTAAALLAALPNQYVGQAFKLRLRNLSSANFAWTVTTNTGITLNGLVAIAQNAWRDFYVTITGLGASAAITVQSIGGGTV